MAVLTLNEFEQLSGVEGVRREDGGDFVLTASQFEMATSRQPAPAAPEPKGPPPGALDYVKNAASETGRGLVSVVSSIPEAIGLTQGAIQGIPAEQTPAYQLGRGVIQKGVEDLLPVDPRLEGSLASQTPNAIGQIGGFMLGGVAGRIAKLPQYVVSGLMGAASGAPQGYEEARASGADLSTAYTSAGLNAAIGLTEAIPVERGLNRAVKPLAEGASKIGRVAAHTGVQAAEESIQEGGQQVLQNLTALGLYDPERSVTEGVGQSMLVGGISGGLAGGTIGGLNVRRDAKVRREVVNLTKDLNTLDTLVRVADSDATLPPNPTRSDMKSVGVNRQFNSTQRAAFALAVESIRASAAAQQTQEVIPNGQEDMQGRQEGQVAQPPVSPETPPTPQPVQPVEPVAPATTQSPPAPVQAVPAGVEETTPVVPQTTPVVPQTTPVVQPTPQTTAVQPPQTTEATPAPADVVTRFQENYRRSTGKADASVVLVQEPNTPGGQNEKQRLIDFRKSQGLNTLFVRHADGSPITEFGGWHDPASGTLVLMDGDSAKVVSYYQSHEWIHSLARTDPDVFNELQRDLATASSRTAVYRRNKGIRSRPMTVRQGAEEYASRMTEAGVTGSPNMAEEGVAVVAEEFAQALHSPERMNRLVDVLSAKPGIIQRLRVALDKVLSVFGITRGDLVRRDAFRRQMARNAMAFRRALERAEVDAKVRGNRADGGVAETVQPQGDFAARRTLQDEDVVNPVDRKASQQAKVAELIRLSEENASIIGAILKEIDASLGTTSKSSFKKPDNILAKANRPSIKAEKPWFDVEHVRDSFRFKTVINQLEDVGEALKIIAKHGLEIVKVDTGKMLNPKEWGWRFAAFDLRMPNGQLVEYYLPLRELEAAKKMGNHAIFEKWRNSTKEEVAKDYAAYKRDMLLSEDRYSQAWTKALRRMGLDENAVRASWESLEARLSSWTMVQSSLNSSAEGMSASDPNSQVSPTRRAGTSRSQTQTSPERSWIETANRRTASTSDTSIGQNDQKVKPEDKQTDLSGPSALRSPRDPRSENLVTRNLANPGWSPEVRKLVEGVDLVREARGEPPVRPDTAVVQEAKARITKDYDGERKRLIQSALRGDVINDTETVIAKEIVNREGLAAIQSGDPDRIMAAAGLVDAYRRTGTEVARALRQRHDPIETPAQRRSRMIAEAILIPPDGKDPRSWSGEVKELTKRLRQLGLDLNVPELLADDVLAARAIATVKAARASNWDKLFEYWRCSILSAPATQTANLTGNLGHATWYFTAERMMEVSVNMALRRPDGAQLGELRHMLAGVLPGMSRGAKNFLRSWKAEVPFFEQEMGNPNAAGKVEDANVAISGTKGRIIRIPQRLLLAVDEFCKSMFSQMEVGAFAYRMAKEEGLSGQAMQTRIHELTVDTRSEAWAKALASSRALTFQQDSGLATAAVLNLRKSVPGLRYLIPFVNTPLNIFKIGIAKSPLGSIGLAKTIVRGVRTGDWSGLTPKLAQQILAWAAVLALLDNDDEDPWITGAAGENKPGTRAMGQRARPPQSIKIGDTWYSYARLEPFATMLALTVDGLRGVKKGEPIQVTHELASSFLGQIGSKTFLSGLGDILDAVHSQEPDKLSRWAGSFAVSWIPNVVRSAGRAGSDIIPERGVWGKGPEWTTRMLRRVLQRTELGILDDQPKYDLWGRPATKGASPIPNTDWLYRMLVPVDRRVVDVAPGDQILLGWNNSHPEDEWFPLPPSKRVEKNGEARYMSDEEYARYCRLSGTIADQIVRRLNLNVENPEKADLEAVRDAISQGRESAKKAMESGVVDDVATTKAESEFLHDVTGRARAIIPYKRRPGESAEDFKYRRQKTIKSRSEAAEQLSRLKRAQ